MSNPTNTPDRPPITGVSSQREDGCIYHLYGPGMDSQCKSCGSAIRSEWGDLCEHCEHLDQEARS